MMGPSNDQDAAAGSSTHGDCEFFMYTFKVAPCPKRGAHDWSACPFAHPKEKARRRDPRVYSYASSPCPESLQGVNCGRGVECPYAHSVYEYWLHPARFRTQMCKKGNACNRSLCFFAHSAAELRFPDTTDDAEAAAVDAAAASASALPLPLCASTPVTAGNSSASLVMLPCAAGSSSASLPLLHMGSSLTSDAGTAPSATASPVNGGSSSWVNGGSGSWVQPLAFATADMRQGSCASQLSGIALDASGSYSFVDPDSGMLLPGLGLAPQQAQTMHVVHATQQHAAAQGANSLSEPLPRLGSAAASSPYGSHNAAWLQLAAASQLPASQIMSSIQPPPAAALAAAHQQQQQQQAQLMAATAGRYATTGGLHHHQQQQVRALAVPVAAGSGGLVFVGAQHTSSNSAGGGSAGQLLHVGTMVRTGSSAEQLAAGMGGMSLQTALADDSSGGSGGPPTLTGTNGLRGDAQHGQPQPQQQQAVYAAAPAAYHLTASHGIMPAAGVSGAGGVHTGPSRGSSRDEDFMLLQMLQDKQMQAAVQQVQQQQQLTAQQHMASSGGTGGWGVQLQRTGGI